LALNVDPLPADSEQLSGYQGLYGVDTGEYRIVYRLFSEQDLVEVILVGKRNDDDVYKRLKHVLGSTFVFIKNARITASNLFKITTRVGYIILYKCCPNEISKLAKFHLSVIKFQPRYTSFGNAA
jgi:mRNA interferase RelE/StbE